MTFAQSWERQERVRHQLLLQQLKSELATRQEFSRVALSLSQPAAPVTPAAPFAPAASSPRLVSRPKPNKPPRNRQELIQAVAVR